MRAVSGIEMALWDLAGNLLGVPGRTLLGGKFRDKVRVYDHAAPRDMLDKASCREWAQKVKADPSGFTAHKFGFPHTPISRPTMAATRATASWSTKELIQIRQGFEKTLPRSHRLGSRHHGPLPLGIRSAHVHSTGSGSGVE